MASSRITGGASIVACLLMAAVGASVQAQAMPPETAADDAAFAQTLQQFIAAKDYSGALSLLESRPDIKARPDGFRLWVQLLAEAGREDEALARLEAFLAQHPDDAVARFQLGELRYRRRHDQAAAQAYRLALAGALDPMRQRMAESRLTQLAQRKPWRAWVGAAIAPDSNFNSATDAGIVEIFGLPFRLNDEARRKAGVGFQAYGGVEYSHKVSENMALRASVSGAVTDFSGSFADNASLSLRAGPEWRLAPTAVVSVQAGRSYRWFGGTLYETGAGLTGEADIYGHNRRYNAVIQAEKIKDHLGGTRDGWRYGVSLARTRYLSASTLWRLSGSANRREMNAAESYTQTQIGVGRLFSGPLTTTIYAELSGVHRTYDGVQTAFGKQREDNEASLEVRISKRDWVIRGAQPYVSVLGVQSRSSIDLYSYSRTRVEFGFTREF